jgi:hypothetical protein
MGVPSEFRQMVDGMLQARTFIVQECGSMSDPQRQLSGISQGCTLSPLLFIAVMTVLLEDAYAGLSVEAKAAYNRGELSDIVYADDTLLVGVSSRFVNEYLQAVYKAGQRYGMELHWDKFQVLPVQIRSSIQTPDGDELPLKEEMQYLGAAISADGAMDHELNRRIGAARHEFEIVGKLWSHSCLTWKRKLRMFTTLIESKLLYSLGGACLTKVQLTRLNGFQNRCLRKIIGIKPSWISRVSNVDVLTRAGHTAASTLLLERQLHQFGKVLRSAHVHPLRLASFVTGTEYPATEEYVRRVGRPAKEFVPDMIRHAAHIFGSLDTAKRVAPHTYQWKRTIRQSLREI